MKNNILLCVLIIILSGCGSSQKARNAKENALFNLWLHHSKTELINAWGKPDSIITDGRNGNILIYKEKTGYINVMNNDYSGVQFSFRKEMYVNADSNIYYWRSWRRK